MILPSSRIQVTRLRSTSAVEATMVIAPVPVRVVSIVSIAVSISVIVVSTIAVVTVGAIVAITAAVIVVAIAVVAVVISLTPIVDVSGAAACSQQAANYSALPAAQQTADNCAGSRPAADVGG